MLFWSGRALGPQLQADFADTDTALVDTQSPGIPARFSTRSATRLWRPGKSLLHFFATFDSERARSLSVILAAL
jgi:hypothetical protein